MKTTMLFLMSLAGTWMLLPDLQAGSATWALDPASGDWNTAANWMPNTVPNGSEDIATFDVSNQTDVSLSARTLVGEIVFSPAANAYTITVDETLTLRISGVGVTNQSGQVQNFVTLPNDSPYRQGGIIRFLEHASAGVLTSFTNVGNFTSSFAIAVTEFHDSSSAGEATLTNVEGSREGGEVIFYDESSAGNATIINRAAPDGQVNFRGGVTLFNDQSSAGNATILNEGGSQSNALGGLLQFTGNATISNLRGIGGGIGGYMSFNDSSSAGGATLIAQSAAVIAFGDSSGGETAQVQLSSGGDLTVAGHAAPGMSIGSLAGDGGTVVLGDRNLGVGGNGLSTTFSGIIKDFLNGNGQGSLTKVGPGTLTLTKANTYSAGTTVEDGALVVSNTMNSGTGKGAVAVDAGTLGGSGIITGAVTVGTGGGPGAFLAPAFGAKALVTLTLQSSLTLESDATYDYTLRSRNGRSGNDLVVANGVTINQAKIAFLAKLRGNLAAGTVFTVINNTSAGPIIGTFSNLDDGAIVNLSGYNFEADYSGGDGNDLTLTAVP